MIYEFKEEISRLANKSIFSPDLDFLSKKDWEYIIDIFQEDYKQYYSSTLDVTKIKFFPGLLATLFYRISRHLFLKGNENKALDFSSLGTYLTSIELYFSAEIGKGLKINHGVGLVIGSRTKIGENVLLHQAITLGEKNGGRAKIGNNVKIYPGAVIVCDVFIGDNSVVGANVFVDKSYPENSKIF